MCSARTTPGRCTKGGGDCKVAPALRAYVSGPPFALQSRPRLAGRLAGPAWPPYFFAAGFLAGFFAADFVAVAFFAAGFFSLTGLLPGRRAMLR